MTQTNPSTPPLLPTFIYHPDPIATESVERSDTVCIVCGQARGYIYVGPVYAVEEYDDQICPWCVADGSAHERLGVTFTDEAGIGGYGEWDNVPDSVMDEVAHRTPGFVGWQQEKWFTHCNDAAAFLGRAGYKELKKLGREATTAIREAAELEDDDEGWKAFYQGLDKDGSPSAYVFRCLHCGMYGAYVDFD